jgi:hypothetical protein
MILQEIILLLINLKMVFQELSQILIVKNYNEAIQLLKDKGLLYET